MQVTFKYFEDSFAICEKADNTLIHLQKSDLPPGTKDGDILIVTNNQVTFELSETLKKRLKFRSLNEDFLEILLNNYY